MALPSYENRQDWASFCRHSYFWKNDSEERWILWVDSKSYVTKIYGAGAEFKSLLPMPLAEVEKRIPSEVKWAALSSEEFSKALEQHTLQIRNRNEGNASAAQSLSANSFSSPLSTSTPMTWIELLEGLKSKLRPLKGELSTGSIQVFEKHFLIRALKHWTAIFLPKKFAVVIDLKSVAPKAGSRRLGLRDEHSLVLVFNQKRLEAYFAENSLGLMVDSHGDPLTRIRAMQERLGMPIQYISLHELDWVDLLGADRPWDDVLKAISEHRLEIMPRTVGLMSWIYLHRLASQGRQQRK